MATSNNDAGLYDPYVKRGAEEGDASNARTQGLQRVSLQNSPRKAQSGALVPSQRLIAEN